MSSVRALVLHGYGINCEREMALGASLAGAQVHTAHAKSWVSGQLNLSDFDLLLLPGGFAFGDELGAAKAFANRITFSRKRDDLLSFIEKGKCIFGVCNGFQLLVKLGILPGWEGHFHNFHIRKQSERREMCSIAPQAIAPAISKARLDADRASSSVPECENYENGRWEGPCAKQQSSAHKPQAALIQNAHGKFESRWVWHKVLPTRCVFTKDLQEIYLPIRHGEGNFIIHDPDRLFIEGHIVLQYANDQRETAECYPDNPNGSQRAIAGICDQTGRVFGMMAHPEAALFFTHLPHWTRYKEYYKRRSSPLPVDGPGLALFKNAVNYLRNL